MDDKNYKIYIIILQNNKYYVHISNTKNINLEKNEWLEHNPPISVMHVIPNCDIFDIDKYTLRYMSIYGIDNVRGGSFQKIDNKTFDVIDKIIYNARKTYQLIKSDPIEKQNINKHIILHEFENIVSNFSIYMSYKFSNIILNFKNKLFKNKQNLI